MVNFYPGHLSTISSLLIAKLFRCSHSVQTLKNETSFRSIGELYIKENMLFSHQSISNIAWSATEVQYFYILAEPR